MMSIKNLIGVPAVFAVTSCIEVPEGAGLSGSMSSGSYLVVVIDRDDRQARFAMMSAYVGVRDAMRPGSGPVRSYDMRNDVLCVESDNLASIRGIVARSLPSGARTELHARPGQSCNDAVQSVTGRKWKELELIPLGWRVAT